MTSALDSLQCLSVFGGKLHTACILPRHAPDAGPCTCLAGPVHICCEAQR